MNGGMSAIGTKQTWASALYTSAIGLKADMGFCEKALSRSLLWVERTWLIAVRMSPFDG